METKPVDLSTLDFDKLEDDGTVTLTAADLKKLKSEASAVGALRQKIAEQDARYEQVAPLALAGLELARQDVTPEEVREHLEILIDADGSYTDEQKAAMLDNIGKDPGTPPSGGTDDETDPPKPSQKDTPMTEDERNMMAAMQKKIDELEALNSKTNSTASHANAQILREKLNKAIERTVSDENFAGGVVKTRLGRYGDNADGKKNFTGTVSKQLEAATLTLLRNEIKAGRQATEIDIEALVNKASEEVGGTLQTVIGEDVIGPLTETVAGESDYLGALEAMGEIKDVTMDDIRSVGSQDEMNELVDRQTNVGFQTLLKAAESAEQSTNGTERV